MSWNETGVTGSLASSSEPSDILGRLFHYTFDEIAPEFGKCHQNPLNVALHLITTPIGLLGAVSLVQKYTRGNSAGIFLFFCYLLSLLPALSNGVYIGTFILGFMIMQASIWLNIGVATSVTLIAASYALQDLAHMGLGEETYQSKYSDGGQIDLANPGAWSQMFFEHVYYLLPLCIHSFITHPWISGNVWPKWISVILDAEVPSQVQQLRVFANMLLPALGLAYGSYCLDSKNVFCFFPGAPYYHRVLQCNIATDRTGPSQKKNLKTVRKWAMKQNPPANKSSHWWFSDLDPEEKTAFEEMANCTIIRKMFRSLFSEAHYALDIVEGMNEIYVTGPDRFDEVKNSDNVFYTRHVDGPWGFIPFASVYRCIVGMDKNEMITTRFPLADVNCNACEGDVLAFDFNREVHYITRDDEKAAISDDFRVVLKLHYCVYPRILAPLGWVLHFANVKYNQLFRALFLKTINPQTLYEHFLAWNVNSQTVAYDRLETLLGLRNLFYLAMITTVAYITNCYEVFLVCTSYVHYFRYISTYYVRKDIDFGSFKRDVLLFKTIALAQLFHMYVIAPIRAGTFEFDVISLAMIIAGYTVSMMATNALGIDRTYFGVELGLLEPKWVTQFPYGVIPHPMITSQVVALLGFFKAAHFRAVNPWVVPVHVTLYLIHMIQEEFNIYAKEPPHPNLESDEGKDGYSSSRTRTMISR